MKEKILDIVEHGKRSSLDRNAIEKALDLKTSGDFVRFSKLIDEMEEECLLVRNKQNKYMTRKQAGLIEGTLSLSRKGVGYIDRENEESIVIMPDDLNGAMHGDTVLVSLKRGTDTGAVRSVLKRGRVRYTGTFENLEMVRNKNWIWRCVEYVGDSSEVLQFICSNFNFLKN